MDIRKLLTSSLEIEMDLLIKKNNWSKDDCLKQYKKDRGYDPEHEKELLDSKEVYDYTKQIDGSNRIKFLLNEMSLAREICEEDLSFLNSGQTHETMFEVMFFESERDDENSSIIHRTVMNVCSSIEEEINNTMPVLYETTIKKYNLEEYNNNKYDLTNIPRYKYTSEYIEKLEQMKREKYRSDELISKLFIFIPLDSELIKAIFTPRNISISYSFRESEAGFTFLRVSLSFVV